MAEQSVLAKDFHYYLEHQDELVEQYGRQGHCHKGR